MWHVIHFLHLQFGHVVTCPRFRSVEIEFPWRMSAPPADQVFPPKCKVPATNDAVHDGSENEGGEGVKMKKELGLLSGISIILGIIMGSGTLRFKFPVKTAVKWFQLIF